ncbi:MAG: hypothetical protein N2Z74_07910, partial [Syntrophales bacterium]|nr:hypothetical protein [Syntrophales bacterium]
DATVTTSSRQEEGTVSDPSSLPATTTAAPAGKPREKLDMAAYLARKKALDLQLEESLAEMRRAAGNGDEKGKEEARLQARAISTEIYRLTDEVKAVNNGKLPPGWW